MRIKQLFWNHPLLCVLGVSALCGLVFAIVIGVREFDPHIDDYVMAFVLFGSLAVTVLLSILNILFLFTRPDGGKRDRALRLLEPFGILFGGIFAIPFAAELFRAEWDQRVVEGEVHAAMAGAHTPTLFVIVALSAVGYLLLRFLPFEKIPPLVAVLSLSAVFLGLGIAVVFLIQIFKDASRTALVMIYAVNLLLIGVRVLADTVIRFARGEGRESRFPFLNRLLGRCLLLPIAAVLAALPLLFFVVIVMMLFGQQPDSLIRVWTETADWTFSQMTPPPSIPYEGHYLCTVAASGHRRVVKPLRTGVRHGHTVVVNRQLQVANAFEELLAERLPRFHRVVRRAYDTVGLPIAKKVKSPYICDILYLLMKPLEWLFLLVLYACDRKPENRIAVQYPHKPLVQ